MAATKTPAGGDFLTRKLGPLPVWAWAAVGVALALYASKKRQASAGSKNAMGVLQSPFGYSAAAQAQAAALGGSSLGAYYPIGYSNYSSSSDLAGVLSTLSGQITSLGAGNSGTNQSPAPSPGNTQTGAANQTSPAGGGSSSIDPHAINGYSYISQPGTGSAEAAAGKTIYVLPSGAPLQSQYLVPWVVGGKVVNSSVPSGSAQYIKSS